MSVSFHEFLHTIIVVFGLTINLISVIAIVLKTSQASKEYALLLLNTSFTEFSSVVASLIVDGRLFLDGSAVVCILHGPCSLVSDRFCGVLTAYMHISMVHSNSILTISFWYRMRILKEQGTIGMLRLQALIVLFFIPHVINIAASLIIATPREILEQRVDAFFGPNSTQGYGMHGFIDISELAPAIVMGYLAFIPAFLNNYIVYTRKRLLGMLREKKGIMSAKTRGVHESFTKVLTISALSAAVIAPVLMGAVAVAQIVFHLHSESLEGLAYDAAIIPALINPSLTLYFVRAYRTFVRNCFLRLTFRKVQPTTSVSFSVSIQKSRAV